jgi:hypothetical protein
MLVYLNLEFGMKSVSFFKSPLILASLSLSIFFVAFLLYYCQVGIDFTDEGFYLNWIAYPFLYKASHTQFGYIYHPLYVWLGENMIRLRQVNLLLMLGLAWAVCAQLFDYLAEYKNDFFHSKWIKYSQSFSLATCVFSFFGVWWWIPTPSYNTLTIESLLIALVGLFEIIKNTRLQRGWMLLGLGWGLAFMGKPSSALLLMLLSTLFIIVTQYKKIKMRNFCTLIATAMIVFCLIAYLIDHSILAFVRRFKQGVDNMALLYDGEMFHFFPHQDLLPDQFTQILFIALVALILMIMIMSVHRAYKIQSVFLFGLMIFCLFVCFHYYRIPFYPHPMQCFIFLAVPLATLIMWCIEKLFVRSKSHEYISPQHASQDYLLVIFLLLMPYLFSFGTNGDVWMNALRMGLFWTLPVMVLVKRCNTSSFFKSRLAISVVLCSQCITVLLVEFGMEYPYRQGQSIFTQTKTIKIQNDKGKVVSQITLSDSSFYYMEQLKEVAFSHGFRYGDPMIDLSGSSPGGLYLLGAKPIGAPWYIDGFGGSTDYVLSILSETPCSELSKAWVLTSLDGYGNYFPYSPRLLEASGLSQNAFDIIPEGVRGGYRLISQLMRPTKIDKARLEKCIAMHQKQKDAYAEIAQIWPHSLPLSKRIYTRALGLIEQHQTNQAITLLKNATIINPSDPYLYNVLCVAYGLEKKYDQAIEACSAGLSIDPNVSLIKDNLRWVTNEQQAV